MKDPVENAKWVEDKDGLLGKTYHFYNVQEKIKSPLSGRVVKVFAGQTGLLIASRYCGLQVMIRVEQIAEQVDNLTVLVQSGAQVKQGQIIFQISDPSIVKSIIVYIPWQPFIVKSVKNAEVSFRNPWAKLNNISHGSYF